MKDILQFLADLKENNHREWFDANRQRYQQVKVQFEKFVTGLTGELALIDTSIGLPDAKNCVFRIFRDVRFSKDKQPYKTNFGAFIANGGRKSPMAGYYIHIEPGESMAGGGIYMPEAEVLKKVRNEIYFGSKDFRSLIEEDNFRKTFGTLSDFDKLKRPPKDFNAGFADIDLLMYKSYAVMHRFNDQEVTSDGFHKSALSVFSSMIDFNRFLNRAFDN